MKPFHIRLPATSANLGPGFDTLAIALDLHLDVVAEEADSYSIQATGRDSEQCTTLPDNLIISVYEGAVRSQSRTPKPLALRMVNGIPIGMGCGSSAAARLAGLALANHFGELGWDDDRILFEACQLEGHPDNAAACWLGGFAVAASYPGVVKAISILPPRGWKAILVLGPHALSTSKARAILPTTYSCGDAVTNLQNGALLTAAFFSGRHELLPFAMQDRMHQPYRSEACPLLPRLLPLVGEKIMGVALSGAGPAVIALVADEADLEAAMMRIRDRVGIGAEILPVRLLPPARHLIHSAGLNVGGLLTCDV